MYTIRYTEDAKNDLLRLQRNEPKAFAKVSRFIQELAEHPKTGTGHPEPLKGQPEGAFKGLGISPSRAIRLLALAIFGSGTGTAEIRDLVYG